MLVLLPLGLSMRMYDWCDKHRIHSGAVSLVHKSGFINPAAVTQAWQASTTINIFRIFTPRWNQDPQYTYGRPTPIRWGRSAADCQCWQQEASARPSFGEVHHHSRAQAKPHAASTLTPLNSPTLSCHTTHPRQLHTHSSSLNEHWGRRRQRR